MCNAQRYLLALSVGIEGIESSASSASRHLAEAVASRGEAATLSRGNGLSPELLSKASGSKLAILGVLGISSTFNERSAQLENSSQLLI